MDEDEFWARLEHRICRELAGSPVPRLRRLWCDGLLAEERGDRPGVPEVRGRAWVGADGQGEWTFTLVVGPCADAAGRPRWDALLPSDAVTGWLAVDLPRRRLVIDIAAARPDPA